MKTRNARSVSPQRDVHVHTRARTLAKVVGQVRPLHLCYGGREGEGRTVSPVAVSQSKICSEIHWRCRSGSDLSPPE